MGRQIIPVQDVIMDQNEHIRKLLKSMDDISVLMLDVIYQNYFDKSEANHKYLLAMFDDAYKTVDIICYSLSKIALTQAGDMIRKLIEQAAIVTVLTYYPEKLPKFVEHYKLRKEIWDKDRGEQSKIVAERFDVKDDGPRTLRYMDYGWVSKGCNETQLLNEAGFRDLVTWKQIFLDKFVHSSYTNIDLVGDNYDYPIIQHLVEITSKAFDYLCCAFHKLTGFDFVINNNDMFQGQFRPLYEQFQIKH